MGNSWIPTSFAATGLAVLLTVACAPVAPGNGPVIERAQPPAPQADGDVARRLAEVEAGLARMELHLKRQSATLERMVEVLKETSVRETGPGASMRGFNRDARDGARLPDKNLRALRQLARWRSDPTVRAQWMLSSAESIAKLMGTPDSVDMEREFEEWGYWVTDLQTGEELWWELAFLNGRLVDCDDQSE